MNPADEIQAGIEQFYPDLCRYARRFYAQPADADDLAHSAIYLAQTRAGQLRDRSKLKFWLFRTIQREFLQQRRRQLRHPVTELSEYDPEIPRHSPVGDAASDSAEVHRALGELVEPYRQPLMMYYLDGLSYREIAARLAVPLGTVMSRLSRGRQQLRALLEPRAHSAAEITEPASQTSQTVQAFSF